MTTVHKNNNRKKRVISSPKEKLIPKERLSKRNRIDLRIDLNLKELFIKAANLSGNYNLTNFIVSTVRERSMQLIKEHESLIVSQKDYNFVLSLLDNPPKPNDALRKAARLHRHLEDKSWTK